jgi:hypothetical protein
LGLRAVLDQTDAGRRATIEVPAELLGCGTVTVRATGRGGPTPADGVNAIPVTVEITD